MRNNFCIKGNITEVYMKDKIILIDTEDLSKICKHSWSFDNHDYAQTRIGTKKIKMHRVILNMQDEDKEIQADHINHNGLDNRKSNLRICTRTENLQNKRLPKNNKSGYQGICFIEANKIKPWRVYISLNKNKMHLGHFSTLEEAIKIRKEAEQKYFTPIISYKEGE